VILKEKGDNKMAKVLAINISEQKGVIKTPIEKGYFEAEHGLVGDAHAGKWHRQVSLLGQESVDKMTAMGVKGLCVGKFAENLTTEGIELFKLPVGTKLEIGETLMEVTQIGKQCHVGCQIRTQVGDCIMPREGIFTRVLKAGWIKPGDEIIVLSEK
jgi:MOSC domain-containing protein YiiM